MVQNTIMVVVALNNLSQSFFVGGFFKDILHVELAGLLAQSLRQVVSQEHKARLYDFNISLVFDVAEHALNNFDVTLAWIKNYQVNGPDFLF